MSCIYLDKEHYEYIADSLFRIGAQFNGSMHFSRTRKELGDLSSHDTAQREWLVLQPVQELQSMNLMAYDERYPAQKDPDFRIDFVKKVAPLGGDLEPCRFLKALQCVRYQCVNSSHFKGSKLAGILDMIIEETRDHIINELPEYKSAKWSIDNSL